MGRSGAKTGITFLILKTAALSTEALKIQKKSAFIFVKPHCPALRHKMLILFAKPDFLIRHGNGWSLVPAATRRGNKIGMSGY
jgi:hypothetical protein